MQITVKTSINASMETVWKKWTNADDIPHWNFASPDWSCPKAQNTLEVGKGFNYRMEAKDGSMGFDYTGLYTSIKNHELIEYKLEDGRKVVISFKKEGDSVELIETFDADDQHPAEMQQQGWQAILDNFKSYVEK
jgi:uncharacterized protein YndB with AHSA1/START domain